MWGRCRVDNAQVSPPPQPRPVCASPVARKRNAVHGNAARGSAVFRKVCQRHTGAAIPRPVCTGSKGACTQRTAANCVVRPSEQVCGAVQTAPVARVKGSVGRGMQAVQVQYGSVSRVRKGMSCVLRAPVCEHHSYRTSPMFRCCLFRHFHVVTGGASGNALKIASRNGPRRAAKQQYRATEVRGVKGHAAKCAAKHGFECRAPRKQRRHNGRRARIPSQPRYPAALPPPFAATLLIEVTRHAKPPCCQRQRTNTAIRRCRPHAARF